jgi:NTE family protein
MDAFGIFEGGGAKGLAHIGALKAAEERGIAFVGVAGASAGAIVACLVAAGYSADELYDPQADQKGSLDKDFLEFFDQLAWRKLQRLKQDAQGVFSRRNIFTTWVQAHLFYIRHRRVLNDLFHTRGFFYMDEVSAWLNGLLAERVKPSGKEGAVIFADIPKPLKIITTDLTNQSIKIYSQETTPEAGVASAVAASASIPLIFMPFHLGGLELVDGGLLSNFPAWVFDDERRRSDQLTPTFGFRLVKVVEAETGIVNPESLFTYLGNLFSTTLSGDSQLQVRQVENLHVIPLRVKVSTMDFDMTASAKEDLYLYGKDGARDFFLSYIGPSNPEEMTETLEFVHSHMQKALNRGDTHLRVNVVMPIREDRLRVLYTYNMDDDTDDRLEFDFGVGASGRCWQTHDFLVSDLTEAQPVFEAERNMNKYQQALIRPSLKSLLSVPIFDPTQFDSGRDKVDNTLLGVLNFDSDEDLLEEFSRIEVQQAAANGAKLVAQMLKS